MNGLKSQSGFSMVLTLIVSVVSIAAVGGLVTIIQNETATVEAVSENYKAADIAEVGMETILSSLTDDMDWSDNEVTSSNAYQDGTYEVTLSQRETHSVLVTSIGKYKDDTYEMERLVKRPITMARDVVVSVDNANLTRRSKHLSPFDVINNGTITAEIEKVIVSWSYEPADGPGTTKIKEIELDGSDLWNPPNTGSPSVDSYSGQMLTFNSVASIAPGTSEPFKFKFSSSITGKVVSVIFFFTDGSQIAGDFETMGGTQAQRMNIDSDEAEFSEDGKTISNINLENVGNTTIYVYNITPSWEYEEPEANIKLVKFDTRTAWSGTKASGVKLSTNTSYTEMVEAQTKEVTLVFDESMVYKKIDVLFEMTDFSTKNISIDNRIDQASNLEVDDSDAKIIGDTISGISVDNSHSDPTNAVVWIDSIKVEMDPDTGQTVSGVEIDGESVLASSGQALNSFFEISRTGITSEMDINLSFSDLGDEASVTISFKMRDETIKIQSFDVVKGSSVAESVGVNGEFARISNSRKNLYNVKLKNSSNAAISVTHLLPIWNPTDGKRIKKVYIDGTRVYSNNSGDESGELLTFSSSGIIPAYSTDTEVKLEFNDDSMTNKDFDLTFSFSDGSSKQQYVNLNPANSEWVAADNFETGVDFDEGAGFSGDWESNYSKNNVIKSSGPRYSGKYHASLKGGSNPMYMERMVTSSAQTTELSLNFVSYIEKYEGNDDSWLMTKVGSLPWQTIHSFKNQASQEYVTNNFVLALTEGESFKIRFESGANKTDELLNIDDVYIK
ncbi:hypothetical protein HOG98_09900 [bacterium]|jgi:hypothetical protein|nr:hypothetical protein [bacterium]